MNCDNDEIRFIINGRADNYETYTYDIPVPIKDNKYHYFAKATLCYFPKCDRNQGVDYTTGEMSVKIGRMRTKEVERSKDGKKYITKISYIQSIDNNIQDDGIKGTTEEKARDLFRKWDNVKHISTGINNRAKGKDTFGYTKWGISVITKDRVNLKENRGIPFSIIVTLKEMDGENRIDEFINMCKLNNWIVRKIDIETYIDINNKAKEVIEFEDN